MWLLGPLRESPFPPKRVSYAAFAGHRRKVRREMKKPTSGDQLP